MLGLNVSGMLNFTFLISHLSLFTFACVQIRHTPLSGGYCGGVPPLPIPNREVKPTCADGTAMQCGRVGSRLLSMKSLRFRKISEAFFPSRRSFSSSFFLHRISRMNRKAILLIGLLTDFHGYLAAGQWLAPEMSSYCFFCHADFTDLHRFFSFSCCLFFFLYFLYFADFRPVGQGWISQIFMNAFLHYCSL